MWLRGLSVVPGASNFKAEETSRSCSSLNPDSGKYCLDLKLKRCSYK